jgi:hypothetical protein
MRTLMILAAASCAASAACSSDPCSPDEGAGGSGWDVVSVGAISAASGGDHVTPEQETCEPRRTMPVCGSPEDTGDKACLVPASEPSKDDNTWSELSGDAYHGKSKPRPKPKQSNWICTASAHCIEKANHDNWFVISAYATGATEQDARLASAFRLMKACNDWLKYGQSGLYFPGLPIKHDCEDIGQH